MDDQKPPGEDKDSDTPAATAAEEGTADGLESSEEKGSVEADPLKPPEEGPVKEELEEAETKEQALPDTCSSPPKRCAFCNCSKWSLHGQRELLRFDPAPGWSENLSSPLEGKQSGSSPEAGSDDLTLIGFADGVSVREVFESTGHFWAHHWCVVWSVGVLRPEGSWLSLVNKAVISGITQKCEHCNRWGATIPCHAERCQRHYHFPCAAASGCFQSMKSLKLLCPEHLDQAVQMEDSRCMVCDAPGELRDLLFCTSCGLHYHGTCLEITVTPRKRSGWQCHECKVCQTCRMSGEDSRMLVCEACEKCYHTYCLKPAIESVPTDSWKCKSCRICSDCGLRPSALDPSCQWYENYSLCEGCQEQRCKNVNSTEATAVQHTQEHISPENSIPTGVLPEKLVSPQPLEETCVASEGQPESSVGSVSLHPEERGMLECGEKPVDVDTPLEVSDADPGAPTEQEQMEVETLLEPEKAPCPPPPPPVPPDPVPPTHPEGSCLGAKDPVPFELQPREPEPTENHTGSSPSTQETESSPVSPPPCALNAASPEAAEVEGEGPSEEPMDTEMEVPVPDSTISSSAQPSQEEEEEEEEEEAVAAPKMDLEERFSPQLSEEEAPDEGPATLGPEPNDTCLSFASETKCSPSPVEADLLGSTSTPVEAYGAANPLEGGGTSGEEEAGPPPPTPLRPHHLVKSDIVNEISNLSQGDASASSFHGSEIPFASPYHEGGGSLSLEMTGLTSTDVSLQREDGASLPMGEMDDSLPFDVKGECEKGRRRSSPARSRVKQGRSSSFPGRRRPRGGSHAGRGRGRSRLKSTTSSIETLALADIDSSPCKDDDDDDDDTMQNTVVLFSNTDKFVLMQDMCVVCGSFGRGAEGHLLACSQCSQCYHPYCVNSKITKVMLLKGWRCVECIVCEVCGKASDPSRLLLCDDCDISYHTYCLDPPLNTVPKGGWKCKWCVCCVQCGAVSPGFHCEWQNNYTHCAPCASLVTCPICQVKYVEDDLLIQCQHCERWMHAVCDNLFTEEEVEQAADEGFDCTSCRPYVVKPVVPVPPPEIIPMKIKEPEPQYFRFEGVWLTETGMAVLRNLSLSPLHKRRPRKTMPTMPRLVTLNGEGGLDGIDPLGHDEKKDGDAEADEILKAEVSVEHMECEIKLEAPATPEREAAADPELGKVLLEDSEEIKKRKRKPYRPGIGGFMVRQRKSHTRLKKGSAVVAEASREVTGAEGHPEEGVQTNQSAEVPAESITEQGVVEGDEKKKRRGRKKSKLEDMFPAYLQEAFFGKALLDLSRKALLAAGGVGGDGTAHPPIGQGAPRPKMDSTIIPKGSTDGKENSVQPKGDECVDSREAAAPENNLKTADAKIENTGTEEQMVPKISPDPTGAENPATPPGEGVLSSDLDKIPTEELPKMESKDVQQLFKDVLGSTEREQQQLNCVGAEAEAGGIRDANRTHLAQRPFLPGGGVSLGPLQPAVSMETYSGVCQSPFLDSRERSGFFSPEQCEPESPWASSSAASTPTTPTTEGETDGLSYNQRSLQRWEKDEELGELSTISPVLYANMNFPNLKQDYPDWSSRCKQIMKLWRKVPAPDKAPYLQKAKDNRAAHRINKVQKQAESQINKQTKVEVLRRPDRPALHLRIPPQQGTLPGTTQPLPPPLPAASAPGQPIYVNNAAALSSGPGVESPSELFLKLPSSTTSAQPPAQVPLHEPYGMASACPPPDPGFPSPSLVGQSPTVPASFASTSSSSSSSSSSGQSPLLLNSRQGPQPGEFQPTPPGTPRHQPSTPDPFLKPRCPSGSFENLSVPGSPQRAALLLSPPPFGEQKKVLDIKKEDVGSGICSPSYGSSYSDSPSGVPQPHEMKAPDVFKAPLTPRPSQVEPQSPGLGHRPPDTHPVAASPPSQADLYRQSPYPDPYAQPPLTPRPQPLAPEGCCPLPPRSLPSDPFSRIPASPQSQSSSQSPLTPRPLSNEAFCQSPVTPRFQSPDPYSRPPSRPQSRDPFAPVHKPPRPQIPDTSFKQMPVSHNTLAVGNFSTGPPSAESHPKASQQPQFARSPGANVFPNAQPQIRFTFPPNDPIKNSPSHGTNNHFTPGKPQSTTYVSSPGFHQAGSPLGPSKGTPDSYNVSPLRPPSVLPQPPPPQQDGALSYLPRTGMVPSGDKREEGTVGPLNRELQELPASQEGTINSNSTQTEMEKQRQRQRLRELLIRQQIQRNNLRQEKESAAAAATSAQASWNTESSGQAFEQMNRSMTPYPSAQDKGMLSTPGDSLGGSKLPSAVMVQSPYMQDERLARPPPAATPSTMDINGRTSMVAAQPFYPRSVFQAQSPQQQMWQQQQQQQQQQQAISMRLPVPSRFPQLPTQDVSRQALGGLATRLPGTGEQIQASAGTVGAQFIELRHNIQKGVLGSGAGAAPTFIQQNPQVRPRFFFPGNDGCNQTLKTSVMPLQAPALGSQGMPVQKIPISPSSQGSEMSNNHHPQAKAVPQLILPPSNLEIQQIPPRPLSSSGPKDVPIPTPAAVDTTPVVSKNQLGLSSRPLPCEVPVEPDLDDDFDSHKDLEDDDDLANLSLDPDVAKGDDDLGNLDNLETNDPHLDDLLNGDEFDLLAYTDPELDTGDKKDIFNEHLRLVESANEKAEREALLKKEPSTGPYVKDTSSTAAGKPDEQKAPSVPRDDGLKSKEGFGLLQVPCSSSAGVMPSPILTNYKAQSGMVDSKGVSLPADIKPKIEEGCLKSSPCQFSSSTSDKLPIKSEGSEKMVATLAVNIKPSQNLMSPGGIRLGITQFPSNSHTSLSDKVLYGTPSRPPLTPVQMTNTSNSILEKFELDGGPLNLPNTQQHSPADDLDKMESSLVASELPLLIEDLLEHEKKELQKKQQLSAQMPGSSQNLQPHTVLAHATPHSQSHDGQLVNPQQQLQLGLVARQQGMVVNQQLMQQQQQRLAGPQQSQVLAPHMGVAQNQAHMLATQHSIQAIHSQQNHQQVLTQKPMPGVQPPPPQQPPQPQQQMMGLKPQQVVMQQQQLANSFFPDTDLDKFATEDIMDPIAKAKMVALKGIKKVMAQGSIGVAPGMNRQQVSLLAQRLSGASSSSEMQNHILPGSGGQERSSDPAQARPNPPTFAQGVINDADQRQYEEWLFHTQQLLQMQLKVLEEQIGVHRKSRKALCAKQRTAKKAGREFPEADAEKLKLVTEQQSKIQKQLDQVRKQQKEHTNLMTEYRNKQQQHQQQTSTVLALSPSQSPRLMAKLPSQLLSAHGLQPGPQGLTGQAGGLRLPQTATMAVQQGLPFMGQQQAAGGTNTFFPSNRLLQERQMQQQRLQLAQKLQQQNLIGQVSMQQQQQNLMGQIPMQQQQQQQQQQNLMSQVSVQQQHPHQSVMGQMPMQQQQQQQPPPPPQSTLSQAGLMGQPPPPPPTPQPGQNLLSKQQGLQNNQPGVMVQQLSPQQQQQQAMLGHSVLQHQGVMTHAQASQRQMLLASQQHRTLGSPQQLAQQQQQQVQGMMGHRILLSPHHQQQPQQPQPGLLGQQQRTLLNQQQQNSIAQQQSLIGQGPAAQQGGPLGQGQAAPTGILSQGQGTASEPIQHFSQHGSLNQALHSSQGIQPAPSQQGLAVKEQQGGQEGITGLSQEGTEGVLQQQQQLRPHLVGQDLGGQVQMGVQEQQGMPSRGTPLQEPSAQLMLQQHGEQQKPSADMGHQAQQLLLGSQQQSTFSSLQLRMQQQQSNHLQQPLRTLLPVDGILQPEMSQQQQQQQQHHHHHHRDAAQPPHLLTQQMEQQGQVQNVMAQQQRIMSQNLEQPLKSLPGQLPLQQQQQQQLQQLQQQQQQHQQQRLQSPAGASKTPGLMVPMQQQQQQNMMVQQSSPQGQSILSSPVMGQIRAQLQGVISKNPQLRNLTPQQQQQLQALLMQRHQQNLLQQNQALRQASPYPAQGQVPLDQGQPPTQQLSLLGNMGQLPSTRQPPVTVAQVHPEQGFVASVEQHRGLLSQQAATSQHQQGVPRLPAPQAPSVLSSTTSQQQQQHHHHPSPSEPKRPSPLLLAKSPDPQPSPTQKHQPTFPSSLLPRDSATAAQSTGETVPGGCSLRESEGLSTKEPVELGLVNGQMVELASPPAGRVPSLPGDPPIVCIKQEPKEEVAQCALMSNTQPVKREANGDTVSASATVSMTTNSLTRTEASHLLLQKLLRAKNVTLATQRSSDVNGHVDGKLAGVEGRIQMAPDGREDTLVAKKPPPPKPKRSQKAGERLANSRKKLRKEDGVKSNEALMKQLKQELSLLPLMEPVITANFNLFSPFGSSPINGKSQLKGSFGHAALDSIPDYYSQLLTKNNLSNPPTPPSSLPPTPPPSVQQKLVNGVLSSEELTEQPKETVLPRREPEGQKDVPPMEVKSLDLLAALPTPPHNQTEDVRMESDEESDSPDSIVPASSPESVLGEEVPRFPLLTGAKAELEERSLSPIIPIIPKASIPAFPNAKSYGALEQVGKGVPGTSWDKAKSSEVSVMLTVSAAAAKNLNGVMVAVAELLSMKIPSSYEVLFPDSPMRNAINESRKGEPDTQSKEKPVTPRGPEGGPEWLKQFDAMLPGYSLKNELDILTLLKQENPAPEKTSQHCYINNVANLDVRQLLTLPEEPSPPLSPFAPSPPSPPRIPEPVPEPEAPPPSSASPPLPLPLPPPPSPPHPLLSTKEEAPLSPLKAKPRSRPLEDNEENKPRLKKWKGVRWKRLRFLITIQKGGAKRDGEREIAEFIDRLATTLRPDKVPRDLRKCCFCHEEGDGATDGPARLLNLDLDLWVHLNCALWSTEVYETQGGALINVEVALHRGLLTKCSLCQKTGATNSCNRIRCPNVYHFACAIRAKCMFFKDKTMLCPLHKLKGPCDQELSTFTVFRRVYIERDEVKQIASIIQRGERLHMFRVGGLVFHAIGQLLPHQMADFHSATALYPVGYEATRIYWSLRTNNRRCCYRCTICENNGRPEFVVQVMEQGLEDLVFIDSSPQAVWNRIIEPVAMMRKEADMLRLFPEYLKGEELFGLTVHAILRIAESLPGVESCQNYLFRYGRHPLMELPLMINPTGCARSEPKILTHYKRPHTLNSTSMSKAYQSTFTGETNTPYSKQFVHSKSSQYRRLKTEWKNNVYLARSRIQGLGLYAAKDLEKHTMVIEYIGTIIRNEVANRREKIYEEQNRGIYMFRINNEHVIDATLTGGPARYINHSCAPNCVAEVVTFDKEDKIIIISSRRIPKGEELTYDYQFDFEDDQHKIPCHCGAWNCRKWMN
ncbi:histone-lysine N-methyltransferase 2D isoform X3 [Sceloporus undulatus]|uniref:histone-lysine N-methyltransferase 2D isoform X3 n=1 Tax=Sceloporus undulatus TaxID=8520 RepID=UPI001C4CF4DE|nr:histone-lysine N-methyltransferase 2D isoform X3 [Sceloporus undulatus]